MAKVQIKRVRKLKADPDTRYFVVAEPFAKWLRLVTLREPHPARVYYATWHGLGVWKWRPKVGNEMWMHVDARDELDAFNKVINWKEQKNG